MPVLLFPAELVKAVYFRGEFNLISLEFTSGILQYLAPYLLMLFLYSLLIQACYAAGKQKSVLVIAVIAVILKFALTGLFTRELGYIGIPLSTTIVGLLTVMAATYLLLQANWLTFDILFLRALAKILAASVPIVLIAIVCRNIPGLAQNDSIIARYWVLPAACIAVILFIIIGRVLKLSEISDFLNLVRRRQVNIE